MSVIIREKTNNDKEHLCDPLVFHTKLAEAPQEMPTPHFENHCCEPSNKLLIRVKILGFIINENDH